LGRLFAVVEELIKWAFESACQLFERFDSRNRVAIFDAGNVAPEQTGAFLDITLGEFLFFAQSTKSVADNHGLSILQLVNESKWISKRCEETYVAVLDKGIRMA